MAETYSTPAVEVYGTGKHVAFKVPHAILPRISKTAKQDLKVLVEKEQEILDQIKKAKSKADKEKLAQDLILPKALKKHLRSESSSTVFGFVDPNNMPVEKTAGELEEMEKRIAELEKENKRIAALEKENAELKSSNEKGGE